MLKEVFIIQISSYFFSIPIFNLSLSKLINFNIVLFYISSWENIGRTKLSSKQEIHVNSSIAL